MPLVLGFDSSTQSTKFVAAGACVQAAAVLHDRDAVRAAYTEARG